ncbi:alkylation response protein AidB-like acyl-CoA dehydrogenase [Desulfosalsimonas propionicica]|uniref:Alkylation response protein AidB-like acyl-CoA dehydrogenase n=1 Tax=Desulfosalsimonas propionicica TaxID=332175 RepID=A0A7W0C7A1_9BACT|nr:acyl-CoA dehydrogenase family protein [Desulfosalsimonas propionicica]MBA2880469.1 alkylation response protein AidB-like acyl-CoA dehydrogenase [Desulfosalsimonas propionicica]
MDFAFTREQQMFKKEIIRFAKKEIVPRVQEHDRNEAFDFEAFRKLGRFGILGLHFPEQYGGSGADVVTTVMAGEALGEAGVDGGLTLAYGAHSFLCADTILRHATEEQRQKYLPRLASGEWIGCMGLTEPDAGSDVASMRTTAEKKGDKYVLNGSKIFITNGPIADVAVVYAKTDPGAQHAGISAFIVEKGTKGFEAGPPLIKMGVRTSQTSELFFSNCEIPVENLLGAEGEGFNMSLQTVEWDRSALLTPFVGAARYMLNACADYAKKREQFGRPIGKFQATKHKLANIRIFYEAAQSLAYRIAWCKDQGRPLNHLEAAVAKLFVGDWSMGPANDAMVLFGGYGYCHEYNMERIFRDSRLAPIGGGTSDIQKMIISRLI